MKTRPDKQVRLWERMTKALKAHPKYRPIPEPPTATNAMLQDVWRLWNLLPEDWTPETRAKLLKISRRRQHRDERAFLSGQTARLSQEPWDFTKDGPKPEAVSAEFVNAWSQPLPRGYHGAIEAAAWWHGFARQEYPAAVERQKRFGEKDLLNRADNLPGSDRLLTAWRTGREFIARESFKPQHDGTGEVPLGEFWKLDAPPLALVNFARGRNAEYRKALKKACQHLMKIGWPLDFADSYTPADAHALVKFHGKQHASKACARRADELCESDKELLDDPKRLASYMHGAFLELQFQEQKEFLKRTHRRSQHWKSARDVAMRKSAGLCSASEFAAEMNCVFPQLPLDEKIKFITLCDRGSRPRIRLDNRRALLCAWAEFNAPVFRAFSWHREAVHTAAIRVLGEQHLPTDGIAMFDYFNDVKPRVTLDLKPAPSKDKEDLIACPQAGLLICPPLELR